MSSQHRTDPYPEPYPEHVKQATVLEEARVIGEFLHQSPYVLAEYQEVKGYHGRHLVPVAKSIEQVFADWFGIDLHRSEDEKRRMLAAIAEANRAPDA